MTPQRIILTMVVAFICTLFLRSLPFLVFRGKREMPAFLKRLGDVLPTTIIAVLVVYCLKPIVVNEFGTESIAMIVASIVVAVSYKIKHSTLLSIALGTVVNMVLLMLL